MSFVTDREGAQPMLDGRKQAVFFNGHLVRHGDDCRDGWARVLPSIMPRPLHPILAR